MHVHNTTLHKKNRTIFPGLLNLCIECSLFELYEYDEIGDHDGDGGGESGPVHVEQPVPGDWLQILYVPEKAPHPNLRISFVVCSCKTFGCSSQLPQAGVEIMDLEEKEFINP